MDAAESSTFNGILLPLIVILTLLLLYYLKPRAKLNIKGKCVLITGCDSGFGRATAIALDKMGVCVLATCLTKEGEQSLNSVTSDKLKTFQLDVTNSEQIKEVRDKVNKLLVNGNPGEYPCSIFAFYCRIVHIIACYPVNSKFFFQGIIFKNRITNTRVRVGHGSLSSHYQYCLLSFTPYPGYQRFLLAYDGELRFVGRRPIRVRAGHFLRLDRNRKLRMKSLWHPGYSLPRGHAPPLSVKHNFLLLLFGLVFKFIFIFFSCQRLMRLQKKIDLNFPNKGRTHDL